MRRLRIGSGGGDRIKENAIDKLQSFPSIRPPTSNEILVGERGLKLDGRESLMVSRPNQCIPASTPQRKHWNRKKTIQVRVKSWEDGLGKQRRSKMTREFGEMLQYFF
ncbi:hypothetical protein AJ87_29640 [Rhizobium yanglingense]|nr:hypothetical protein AJ87_29640 [Rhizobium yanglingense]